MAYVVAMILLQIWKPSMTLCDIWLCHIFQKAAGVVYVKIGTNRKSCNKNIELKISQRTESRE